MMELADSGRKGVVGINRPEIDSVEIGQSGSASCLVTVEFPPQGGEAVKRQSPLRQEWFHSIFDKQ